VRRLRLAAFAEAGSAAGRGFTYRDAWTFLYLGFFGVSVNQFCFTLGLHYTSVSHSAIIVGMGPVYVLILAVMLRLERATWHSGQHVRQWIMLLGMVGVTPDRPLTAEDYAGLPLPMNAWDG